MTTKVIKVFSLVDYAIITYKDNRTGNILESKRYQLNDTLESPSRTISYAEVGYYVFQKYSEPTITQNGTDYVTSNIVLEDKTYYLSSYSMKVKRESETSTNTCVVNLVCDRVYYFEKDFQSDYNLFVTNTDSGGKTQSLSISVSNLGSSYSIVTLTPDIKVYSDSAKKNYLFTIKPIVKYLYTGSGVGD